MEEVLLGEMRENTVFTQHWNRRPQTIITVCDYPVSVQSLPKQASHAAVSAVPSPSAWPDRLPSHGLLLPACHLPEDRKLVQAIRPDLPVLSFLLTNPGWVRVSRAHPDRDKQP